MKNRNVLFTFDYELFLGLRSGTVEKCLLQPTDHILRILQKYKIENAVFFVDTVYLYKLSRTKTESCQSQFSRIKTQLQSAVNQGHILFPHIHPHWLDAVFDEA